MKKTRKVLSILLSILLALSFCTVAFAEGDECAHENMEVYYERPALCGQLGNLKYYFCPDCEQFFADYEGLEPITLESVSVAPDFEAHDFLADIGFEEIENGIWLSISPEEDAAYIEEFGKGFFEAFAEMGIKLEAKYCSHCGVVVIVDDGEEITEVAPFELALTVNGEYVAPSDPGSDPADPGKTPTENKPAEENKDNGNSKGAFAQFLETFLEFLKNLITFFMSL